MIQVASTACSDTLFDQKNFVWFRDFISWTRSSIEVHALENSIPLSSSLPVH